MGVRILKRAYGNAYAPSTEQKPDWLIGNVGDWIRLNMEVEAGVDYIATQQNPVSVNKEDRNIILMNGKKWSDYGFDIGAEATLVFKIDTTDLENNTTTQTFIIPFEIEQLFNDVLVYAENLEMNSIPYEIIPTDRGTTRVYSVKFFDSRDIEGVRMKYANISNSEVENNTLISPIDGTETELYFRGLNNIDSSSGWQQMDLIGYQSGMSIDKSQIRKIGENIETEFAILEKGKTNFRLDDCRKGKTFDSIRTSWAMPINLLSPALDYKSVTENNLLIRCDINNNIGDYLSGESEKCFLYNSSSDNTKKYDISVKYKVTGTNKNNNNSYIRLVIVKYNNGTSLDFDSVVELKRWNNNEFPLGNTLDYSNSLIMDIQEGESYALALEWNHPCYNITRRYIDVELISQSIQIYDIDQAIVNYKKKYEIEIDFMLSSFFDEITDLENLNMPDVLFNTNSLTDAIKLTFLPEWNNPNIKIENDMNETQRLGNTGWFNENYNALPNNFKVESLEYFDLAGIPVSGLSYGKEVKVKAVISGIDNLTSESDLKHGFIWLPVEEEQYKNRQTPFHKNTKISSNFSVTAFNPNTVYPFIYEGYSNDEAKMNTRAISYSIQRQNLVFEAIFSPTTDFSNFFEERINDRKYCIWISVADASLTTSFSNRVSLLLDVNDLDLFIPISGELEGVTNSFLEHPEDYLENGVNLYNGFLEDDILARTFFGLENGKKLNQVVLGFEVENKTTGISFELERFNVNTEQYVMLPSGVQQIDFNSQRGYKLEPNNNKNWVKVIRNEDGDGNGKAGYQILFGQKIRWEYWIQKNNVPSEYYDANLPLNGNNNDWLHFLRKSGNHKINYFVLFDVVENGETLRYKNSFEIKFNGYDENPNIETDHKYIDNETNNILNVGNDPETGRPLGVLLSNKNTRIEITYTKLDGDWDLGNVYSVTTLEINEGAGVMSHRQLSSIVGSETDNILIPLTPNQKLLVELIQPNVIKTTCLVDYTKLEKAFKYKITGRIGCFANENGVPILEKKYDQNDYELNYE